MRGLVFNNGIKAPQVRNVSNRRWSVVEPADSEHYSSAPQGLNKMPHLALAELIGVDCYPPVPLASLAPPTVTRVERLWRSLSPLKPTR